MAEGVANNEGKGYGELLSNAVNKIPIVGQFKQAGESIRELITGEKAELEMLEKKLLTLDKINDKLRNMAAAEAQMGKYGHEQASLDADKKTNENITKLHTERAELGKELRDIESKDANIGWYTDKQKKQMEGLKAQIKIVDKQVLSERKLGNQAQKDLQRQNDEEQHQYLRRNTETVLEFEAKAQEKALRRQGEAIKSAIVGIKAKADAEVRAAEENKSDFHLAGLSDKDKAARIESENQKIAAIRRAEADTVEELEFQDGRKKAELAKDNEEKLTEIRANGAIERLKLQDEATNTANEKSGAAARSHLAESAQIEEEYRRNVAGIEKHFREERKTDTIDANDPEVKAQIAAAGEEKTQKLALVRQKAETETAKNAEAHLKEMRKLWQGVGTPQEKYLATLEDINEQFEKYGDAKLRDRETEKLDKSTFEELKKQNPDHDPKVNMYGRTLDFDFVPAGDQSSQIAAQQLAEMKAQNQRNGTWDRWFNDIWQTVVKTGESVQELSI